MYRIVYLFILCSVFFSSLSVSFTSFARVTHSEKHVSLGTHKWIETKLRQYPELLWLMDSTINQQDSLPLLNFTDVNVSLLNETLTSLAYLQAFLNGTHSSYLFLKQQNPLLADYTFKDFLSVHKKLKNFFKSFNPELSQDEFIRITETAIVLKNIYGSSKVKKLFSNYFISPTISSEEFYTKSLQVLNSFPELSPSFRRLTKKGQSLVSHARTFVNYKNLLSLSLEQQTLGKTLSPADLNFDLLIFFLDLCGTEVYTLAIQNDFFALIKNMQQKFDFQTKSLAPVYYAQLHYEGEKYGEQPTSIQNISRIRLAKALKLESLEEFAVLKQALACLDEEIQSALIHYMAHPENNPPIVGLHAFKELIFHTLTVTGQKDCFKKSLFSTLTMLGQSISFYKEQVEAKAITPVKQLNFLTTNVDTLLLENAENLLVNMNKKGDVSFVIPSNNY